MLITKSQSPVTSASGNRRSPRDINRGLIAETGQIPHGYQFLQDSYPLKIIDKPKPIVVEDVMGRETPAMLIRGLFQEADIKNANGRIYPLRIIREAVDAIQSDLTERAVLGEFDHPPDAKIHLDRISHLVTKVWMDGKRVYGEAEILGPPFEFGEKLKGLFEHAIRTGISSRGIGDMEVRERAGEQIYYVTEGYAFVTWDIVAEPSVKGAILSPVQEHAIREGKNRRVRRLNTEGNKKLFTSETYQALAAEEICKSLKAK